jgi:hypothetical protein
MIVNYDRLAQAAKTSQAGLDVSGLIFGKHYDINGHGEIICSPPAKVLNSTQKIR